MEQFQAWEPNWSRKLHILFGKNIKNCLNISSRKSWINLSTQKSRGSQNTPFSLQNITSRGSTQNLCMPPFFAFIVKQVENLDQPKDVILNNVCVPITFNDIKACFRIRFFFNINTHDKMNSYWKTGFDMVFKGYWCKNSITYQFWYSFSV